MEEGSQYSIHSICRICLVHLQTDNAYDLFMTPGLAKKLCVCTSLSVEPQDGFPKNLCGICYGRLNDLHDFQKLCVDSVQKFQEMVANNTFACMPHVNTFDILEEPNTDDHDGQNFDDDRINFDPLFHHKMEIIENEDEVVKMLEHVDKEEEESEKEQENKDKDNNDQDNENLNLNLNTKFTSESSSSSSSDEFDNDDDDEDYAANESVTKNNAQAGDDDDDDSDSSDDDMPLALRLRKRRGGASATTTTARRKPTKVRRKRDPKAEKQQVMIIDCHICHQKFKKPKCYQEHMKYHNDKLPYQCSVETCQKGFTTANGLRMHVDHAHSELSESHACPEEGCGQVFPRSRLLTWHLRKVHNKTKTMIPPKMHPCPNCEKIFRCPMALKKHMYKHDGKELPFPCNICGKRFVINSALKEHLMRHAGIKNYVCPYCGVGKTTRQEWNNHINMHTQEKRYQCHLCEHSSHNKQALTNHVRVVHEKIKNYACQYCGKTFGKSHACKIHEMTHTGEKRCECKVCGKRFLYPKSLTKHLKTHEKRVLRAIEVYRKRQEEMGQQATEAGVAAAAAAAGDAEAQLQQAQQAGEGQAVAGQGQGNPIQPQAPRKVNPNPKPRAPRAPNAGGGAGTVNRTSGITRAPPIADTPNPHLTEEILKACAESVATIPRDPRRVERVDISQLAGTSVNPIPQVSVPSWSPQVNFTMKEGKHICPGCGKGFNNIGNMKRHYKIIHEKVKDFACRFCERRFAKAQTLRHHEMTHTGEKPYECKVCLTRFRQDVALKRHMKVHQNKPPVIPAKFYAAREELALKEREELDAKRKLEEEKAAITARAREQLKEVKKAIELEKLQKLNMYNNGGGPPPDEDDEEQSGSKKRGNTPEKFFATQEEAAQKELEEAEAKKKKELKREAIAERAREQLAEVKMQIENRYNTLKYTDLEQPKRESDESDGDDDDEEDEEDDEEDDVAAKSEPNVSGGAAAAAAGGSGSNASAAADISITNASSAAVGCGSSNLPNSEVFAEFNNMGMPCSQTSASTSSDQPPAGTQEFMPEYPQHNV